VIEKKILTKICKMSLSSQIYILYFCLLKKPWAKTVYSVPLRFALFSIRSEISLDKAKFRGRLM